MKVVSKLCRIFSAALIIFLAMAAVSVIVPAFSEIGDKEMFCIPFLEYLGNFVRTPLGVVIICAVLIALVLLKYMPSALEKDREEMNWDYN